MQIAPARITNTTTNTNLFKNKISLFLNRFVNAKFKMQNAKLGEQVMINAIEAKSFSFAVRIVNLYKHLTNEKSEYISIGANVAEAQRAQSPADFNAK